MKLCEIATSWVEPLTDKQKKWLDKAVSNIGYPSYGVSNWKYNPDTKLVDVYGNMRVYDLSIPVPLGTVTGNVFLSQAVYTLKNSPRIVKGDFDASTNSEITTLEGAPEWVGGSFMIYKAPIRSLDGLPQFINGVFECGTSWFVTHILQAFKHKQILQVATGDPRLDNIVNPHLAGDRDLLMCQDELIDAGLSWAAKL